jgi:hypothetical protein
MALTDAKCRATQPGAKLQKLTDGGGLQLLVQPSGARLWRLACRFGGKQKLLALGVYPTISLARARQAREDAKRLLAAGADPTLEKKRRKQEHTGAATFRSIADEYVIKLKCEGRADATIAKTEWLLAFADADLGSVLIRSVDAPAVLKVLRAVEIRGRYESARRLRSTIGSVFRYAVATARADADPTYALRGALIQVKARPRAGITDPKALGALLRAIDAFDGQQPTRIALLLMAFLFPRPGELRAAEWVEFDLARAIWTIQRHGRKCVSHTGCHSQVKRSSCSGRCNCYPTARPAISGCAIVVASDLRQHTERCFTTSRIRQRRGHRAWLSGVCVKPPQ